MAINYVFVRMPEPVFQRYKDIQVELLNDLKTLTGKNIKIPMTKIFDIVVSTEWNENYIQIDLKKLIKHQEKKTNGFSK